MEIQPTGLFDDAANDICKNAIFERRRHGRPGSYSALCLQYAFEFPVFALFCLFQLAIKV